jgi:hypothetical protein
LKRDDGLVLCRRFRTKQCSALEGALLTVERIKCTECDNMILPQTAAANGGLCAPCAKIPEYLRRARREHESKLASGAWFIPSAEERGTAKLPCDLVDPAAMWSPEPEYYKESPGRSARDVIEIAAGEQEGHVFLVSNLGGRLSFAFNEVFGVCEYQNGETRDNLYAYTPDNLTDQVSADRHLVQACSCCGVGLLWYPSRFHMPRRSAFGICSELALGRPRADAVPVEWLDCGDTSYTARGRG